MELIFNWLKRHLGNPQIAILLMVSAGILVVVIGFGTSLMPVLAGVMIAYLLEGPVQRLERMGLPRLPAMLLVFIFFLTALTLIVLGILPALSLQITDFVERFPEYMVRIRSGLAILPEKYPDIISQEQFAYLIGEFSLQMNTAAREIALRSISGLVSFFGMVVYIFLVPVLVFFFMKDKASILEWLLRFLPENRALVDRIGQRIDIQMSNYFRGKVIEMAIMTGASYMVFQGFQLNYTVLLSTLVGLSVFIPVVGAVVMTLPVLMLGYLKLGLCQELMWLTLAYIILQQLDGNLLAPVLFSRINNLHPVAIISSVLVFGGIWGFWRVFFAIPLATLIHAVIQAWPRETLEEKETPNAAIET